MLSYLILLFTILPAVELILLIKVGSYIGAFNTLFIIIGTGIAGAYLAKIQGFFIIQKIHDNLNRGIMPNDELLDGAMILAGGILLLTPGFLTDFLGLFLLIPFTRKLIKFVIQKKINSMIKNGKIIHTSFPENNDDNFDDIDID